VKPTVLVTGATGFVGSHLVRKLVQQGHDVHILCRQASNFWRLTDILGQVSRHEADLRDASLLNDIVKSVHPRYIFHLASATVVAGSTASSNELVNVNLQGTINLLQACDQISYDGIVCTGDSFEYSPSFEPLREDGECRPESLHGLTKLAATLHGMAIAKTGRPVVSLRLFSTYGPGDNPARLVPRVIAGAMNNTPILLSRPQIARDWIFIDDVASIYIEAAHRADQLAGGVFNVGSGEKRDLGEIADLILRLTKSTAELRWGVFNAPAHDAHPWIADTITTLHNFTWRPKVGLEEGLSLTVADWVANNKDSVPR
jgi:nucleoside-diphosphate-sugar epimerase